MEKDEKISNEAMVAAVFEELRGLEHHFQQHTIERVSFRSVDLEVFEKKSRLVTENGLKIENPMEQERILLFTSSMEFTGEIGKRETTWKVKVSNNTWRHKIGKLVSRIAGRSRPYTRSFNETVAAGIDRLDKHDLARIIIGQLPTEKGDSRGKCRLIIGILPENMGPKAYRKYLARKEVEKEVEKAQVLVARKIKELSAAIT